MPKLINGYTTGTSSDRPGWAYAEVASERREWQLAPDQNPYAPYGNYALKLAYDWASARYAELRTAGFMVEE
jgi:hypothetical protein